MKTTLTLVAIPATRTDGTAVLAAAVTGFNVYKNGELYQTVQGQPSAGTTWADPQDAANGDKYDVTFLDNQTPPVEGVASNNYVVVLTSSPLAQLSAGTISGATA